MAFSWLINGGDPNYLQVLGWSSKYASFGGQIHSSFPILQAWSPLPQVRKKKKTPLLGNEVVLVPFCRCPWYQMDSHSNLRKQGLWCVRHLMSTEIGAKVNNAIWVSKNLIAYPFVYMVKISNMYNISHSTMSFNMSTNNSKVYKTFGSSQI